MNGASPCSSVRCSLTPLAPPLPSFPPPSPSLCRQRVPVTIDPACAKELRSVKARMEALEARARVRAHADL